MKKRNIFIVFTILFFSFTCVNAEEKVESSYDKDLSFVLAEAIKNKNIKIVLGEFIDFEVLLSDSSTLSQSEKRKLLNILSGVGVDLLDLQGKPIRGEVLNSFYVLKTLSTAFHLFSPYDPSLFNRKWLLFLESPLNINHPNFVETQNYIEEANLSNDFNTSNYFLVYLGGYAAVCIDCDASVSERGIPVASEEFVSDIKILSDAYSKVNNNDKLRSIKDELQNKLQTSLGLMVLDALLI